MNERQKVQGVPPYLLPGVQCEQLFHVLAAVLVSRPGGLYPKTACQGKLLP